MPPEAPVTARAPRIQVDPDVGIPDLVKSLTADSRRLVGDELRLAKIETAESLKQAGKGAMWMGVAFGVSIVALVALTMLLVTGIGRLVGNYWAGALATGALELLVAAVLFKRGIATYAEPSYTLSETREQVAETARWVADPSRP
jgi:uncharacterized membrane protein YqjE